MESESSTEAKVTAVERALESIQQADSQYGLSLLASTLAHEIRNPLQSIRLQIDAAKRGGSPQMALQSISDSITRLESVVHRVQQLSQRYELQPESVNLKELVESALSAFQYWFSAAGVIVRTHTAWEGEPLVRCDRELVQQVLLNLLMNAIQAMPRGGEITLELSEELDNALIQIEDTGVGMNAEQLAKVGTPFFTTKANGNGLGLSFCKTIAALHGGGLEISSKQQEGTRVVLRLAKVLPEMNREEDTYVS